MTILKNIKPFVFAVVLGALCVILDNRASAENVDDYQLQSELFDMAFKQCILELYDINDDSNAKIPTELDIDICLEEKGIRMNNGLNKVSQSKSQNGLDYEVPNTDQLVQNLISARDNNRPEEVIDQIPKTQSPLSKKNRSIVTPQSQTQKPTQKKSTVYAPSNGQSGKKPKPIFLNR